MYALLCLIMLEAMLEHMDIFSTEFSNLQWVNLHQSKCGTIFSDTEAMHGKVTSHGCARQEPACALN